LTISPVSHTVKTIELGPNFNLKIKNLYTQKSVLKTLVKPHTLTLTRNITKSSKQTKNKRDKTNTGTLLFNSKNNKKNSFCYNSLTN